MRPARLLFAALILLWGVSGCSTAPEEHTSKNTAHQIYYTSPEGVTVAAHYTDDDSVSLTFNGGKTVTLPLAISASGARYADAHHVWWEHQGEGRYSVDGTMLFRGKVQR